MPLPHDAAPSGPRAPCWMVWSRKVTPAVVVMVMVVLVVMVMVMVVLVVMVMVMVVLVGRGGEAGGVVDTRGVYRGGGWSQCRMYERITLIYFL
jgi:hypothetical protein